MKRYVKSFKFILIASVVCIFFLLKIEHPELTISNYISTPGKKLNIYISIYSYWGNNERIYLLYKSWLSKVQLNHPETVYEVISDSPIKGYENITRVDKAENKSGLIWTRLISRFFFGCRRFLHLTSYNWYYVATDDTHVILPRLISMIEELDKKHNYGKDIVLKGMVVRYSPEDFFIHGGSGWIFSRAAIVKFLSIEKEYYEKVVTKYKSDDTALGHGYHMLGLTIDDIYDPRFFGIEMNQKNLDIFQARNYSALPTCIFKENVLKYNQMPAQFNKLVSWHSSKNGCFPLVHGDEYDEGVPDDVHIVSLNSGHFCMKRSA